MRGAHARAPELTAGAGSGFAANAAPFTQDLVSLQQPVLAAFPGNASAANEYNDAVSKWQTLTADQDTPGFFP